MGWKHKVEIKHLFTESEQHKDLKKSMTDIAGILEKNPLFNDFDFSDFKKLPKGGRRFKPVDYANSMLNDLYNFCDEKRIWLF